MCPASRDWRGRVGCSCESSIILVSLMQAAASCFALAACARAAARFVKAREVFGSRAGGPAASNAWLARANCEVGRDYGHATSFRAVRAGGGGRAAAAGSRRGAQDCGHLAAENLEVAFAGFGPRDPVERIFQQGGEGSVVFRRRDGEAVVPARQFLERLGGRWAGPVPSRDRHRRSAWGSRAGRRGWLPRPPRAAPRRFGVASLR